MPHTATRLTPLIESRATEEELAATAVLLGGNRPRSREPPKRVAMHAQVVSRLTGIEPLVCPIGAVVLEASNDRRRQTIDKTVDQQVDDGAVVTDGVTQPARHRCSASRYRSCHTRSKFGVRLICSNMEQPSGLLALPRRVR